MKTFSPLLLLLLLCACGPRTTSVFKVEELSPWCILGFDAKNRTPAERIAMVKQMGFTKYGYNKGKGDLSTMKQEFQLARKNNIEITSVFLWLNAKRDSIGKLGPDNQELLRNLSELPHKPAIWLSFSPNFFENLNQEQSVALAVEMVQFIASKADEIGCKLALYNHHGWFGNPFNQIEILEKLNQHSISMVYNFHHAQEYVDEFPEIVKRITPYVSYVNISGVKKEGPQILSIGAGDYEFEMIQLFLNEGYRGPWGILGHIETEDVQKVLKRNLEGLYLFNPKNHKE